MRAVARAARFFLISINGDPPMGRNKVQAGEGHNRSFRVRLLDKDANDVVALAKKSDIAPSTLLRTIIHQQLPIYRLNQQVTSRVTENTEA
jgi:hypothetical protein